MKTSSQTVLNLQLTETHLTLTNRMSYLDEAAKNVYSGTAATACLGQQAQCVMSTTTLHYLWMQVTVLRLTGWLCSGK